MTTQETQHRDAARLAAEALEQLFGYYDPDILTAGNTQTAPRGDTRKAA